VHTENITLKPKEPIFQGHLGYKADFTSKRPSDDETGVRSRNLDQQKIRSPQMETPLNGISAKYKNNDFDLRS
jgi:hypothetical protein